MGPNAFFYADDRVCRKMSVKLSIRTIKASDITEMYITAVPRLPLTGNTQNQKLFCGIAEALRQNNAHILQERIFITEQTRETAASVRTKIYNELDDGVSPTWLVGGGTGSCVVGIQVHAIAECGAPEVLKFNRTPCGRVAKIPELLYLTLSNIQQPAVSGQANQARAMLLSAESILNDVGINFGAVPRTWMWLKDILKWYNVFNQVRNTFFRERGIIAANGNRRMPASTGIGIHTGNDSVCAMELAAVAGRQSFIEYLDSGGNQNSALDYGSAFSRSCKTRTPAGYTVYVSGTASIAADGSTLHPGDAQAQIETTVDNVCAVLKEFDYGDDDIVHAIAYCKTPEVRQVFIDDRYCPGWPIIPVIADICRGELLFEIEVTAARNIEM
jgi:enamine deaminase RidA (YjgF/YER057c/UK114 family)